MKKQFLLIIALFAATLSFAQTVPLTTSKDTPLWSFSAAGFYTNAKSYRTANGLETSTAPIVASILQCGQALSKQGCLQMYWSKNDFYNRDGSPKQAMFDELSKRGFNVQVLGDVLVVITWVPAIR